MSDSSTGGRPVPQGGEMSQEDQAKHLVATGDGIAHQNEAELLEAVFGPANGDGVYGVEDGGAA